MKRFIALLLVFCSLFPTVSFALDESASVSELLDEHTEIMHLVFEKLGYDDPDFISDGVYIVGRDIRAGQYELICTYSPEMGELRFEKVDTEEYINEIYTYTGGLVTFDLIEGEQLKVYDIVGILRPATKRNWQP